MVTQKWYDAYTMHMGVEKYIRVTQAMYDMNPIDGLWVSEEGKIYLCPREKIGVMSYMLRPSAIFAGKYPHIRRRIGVVYKNFRVHRIIACTLNPIENLNTIRGVPAAIFKTAKTDPASMLYLYHSLQVNHINHDPQDYSVENLEWCTPFENTQAYHQHAGFDKLRESKQTERNDELEKFIKSSKFDRHLRSYVKNDDVITIRKIA